MKQYKIVIDTNVWISAVRSRGICRDIIRLCIMRHKIFSCEFIVNEIREKLIKKFKVKEKTVELLCEYITKVAIITKYNLDSLPNICKDKDDNHILACCLKAEADWLITGDCELLELKEYKKTKIASPREFLNWLLKQK